MKASFLKYVLANVLSFLLPVTLMAQAVTSIHIDATINPAVASFIHSAIAKAEKEKSQCLVIHLNTPGGLLKATRSIVGDIIDSRVPVVVYVSPSGAQAGSAGVFITMSAHIAAMTQGTNIGAAHPVGMQGGMDTTMSEKVTNDAVAFIQTIAEKRGRNAEWAENAVRNSVSVTATVALQQKIIDLVANDDEELLEALDGRSCTTTVGVVTLHTRGAKMQEFDMSFIEKLLNILSDPNIAYIVLMLGFYGLMFELYNPGAILPGIVGVICLVLALYSLNTLPINYAGLALILFALLLFILELKIASHGVLAIGGVVSLLLGSMMLIRRGAGAIGELSWTVIISSTLVTTLFFLFVIGMGLRAQRLKPVTGSESMIGETGEARDELSPEGMVFLHGELWQAESLSGAIHVGDKVRVKSMKGFKLFVEKVEMLSN
ncbi:MAG TPA: nodulation protein NfeD [Flavisolibacter sp.]|jgi:membrane-bound serine protease (ClpP class)